MKTETWLAPSHRVAAALAAAVTTFAVIGTVALTFDAANPVPELPELLAGKVAPAVQAEVAPRHGMHDRRMVAARVDSPAPAR